MFFPSVIKGIIENTGIEFLLLSKKKASRKESWLTIIVCFETWTSLSWHIIYIFDIFQIYLNNISLISPTAVFWSESWRIVWPSINSLVRTPLPWPTETWAPHCNVILYLYTSVMCKLHYDVMSFCDFCWNAMHRISMLMQLCRFWYLKVDQIIFLFPEKKEIMR